MGHALSTPFGALKRDQLARQVARRLVGHALSTPFGALKLCDVHVADELIKRGMPSQRPSGH